MRVKVFNKPKFTLFSWVELGTGAIVAGGLAFNYFPF